MFEAPHCILKLQSICALPHVRTCVKIFCEFYKLTELINLLQFTKPHPLQQLPTWLHLYCIEHRKVYGGLSCMLRIAHGLLGFLWDDVFVTPPTLGLVVIFFKNHKQSNIFTLNYKPPTLVPESAPLLSTDTVPDVVPIVLLHRSRPFHCSPFDSTKPKFEKCQPI